MNISKQNFTREIFRNFLVKTIFNDVLFCEFYHNLKDPSSQIYLMALGKLMEEYYIVSISSDKLEFEDLQIVCLSPSLVEVIKQNL